MKNQIEISSSRYFLAHGKQPSRMSAYWAFDFICIGRPDVTEFAPPQMKLSDAKKWARERAAEIPGCFKIQIGS